MFICAWADKPAAALGEPSEPADELVARQVFVAARGAVRDATLRGVARAGASLHVAEPDVTESGVRWLQDAMVSDVPRAAESAPELVALEAVVAAALATAAPVVAVWSAAARDRLDAGLSTVPVASPGLAPAHVLSAEAAVRDRAAANQSTAPAESSTRVALVGSSARVLSAWSAAGSFARSSLWPV